MIYIIRHSETKWNVEGRLQGRLDSPLTKKGIEDAKRDGEYFKDKIDLIISSPAQRAITTSEIIKGDALIPIITNEDLSELNHGAWQGLTIKEIEANYKESFHDFMNNHKTFIPVGDGESFKELEERVIKTMTPIIKEGKDKNILVVSHGAVMQIVLLMLNNQGLDELKNIPVPKNSTIIKIDNDSYEILTKEER